MNRQILKNIVLVGLFAIPFIPFLVSGSLFFPFITTKGYAFRIIIEVIFSSWVLLALIDPIYRPRKSWTTYALFIFIALIGIADIFGAAPVKSFWSNSERMEGFISLLHFGMFFLVIRNVFNEINWRRWWNTSLAASFLMVIYCIFQLVGAIQIHQGGARVDGTLGNAAYLAVYMLFNIFIALIFLARSRGSLRWVYGALVVCDTIILYYTATRGAILGLMGGLLIASLFGLRNKESNLTRKLSLVYVGAFVVIVLGFFAIRQTSFVQSSSVLSRFASISSAELKTEGRSFVWPIGLKGVLEHPVLGWGQDNFNYVFNEHYSPEMYKIEPWFDRAHNIFLDWAIQGGIVGLLAYLALYYVLLRGVWKSAELSRTDKALITGLVAAYFFHNIFVFDNLISYILFISLLAFADSYKEAPKLLPEKLYDEKKVESIGMPLALVLLLVVLYFVNVKPIKANMSLITALTSMQTGNATDAMKNFESAYAGARLGRPEIVEQIASNAPQILGSDISADDKNAFYTFAKNAVEKQAADLSTDARYQLLAGTFLENVGQFTESLPYLLKAEMLTPGKQLVYYEIAGDYINMGDYQKGLATLKTVYDLDHSNIDAEVAYLVGAIYAGDRGVESSLKTDLREKSPASLDDDRIINAYIGAERYADVVVIFKEKLSVNPSDPQLYVNLAAVYLKAGDKKNAIATLNALAATLPDYKSTVDSYIEQIQNGTLK